MRHFSEILDEAAQRKGGHAALGAALSRGASSTPAEIAALPDDRVLAEMSRRVFHAGFSWKVVDRKWPAFEDLFEGFDPLRCAAFSADRLDALLADGRIVRNGAKIRSIALNAAFILELSAAHGNAAHLFANWPAENYVGLLELLKKKGSRLGGQAGMRFLRSIGVPSFITTGGVVTALRREGVLSGKPGSRRDQLAIQAAFNEWNAQSGLDLTAISRVLAMTVGEDSAFATSAYITPSLLNGGPA